MTTDDQPLPQADLTEAYVDLDAILRQREADLDAEEFRRAYLNDLVRAPGVGLSASEVLEAALVRFQRDPLAHMRAELAVRVVDTRAGNDACDPADYRTLIRAGAIVALELTSRTVGAPEDKLSPRDVLAVTLAAHGAPQPVEGADALLAALERNGLTVVPR